MRALAPALLALSGLQGGGATNLELPPRRPVAGMHGFHAVSSITYPARPELPHRLEVHYQFPARARWSLESTPAPGDEPEPREDSEPPTEASSNRRVLEYRVGARGYQVLPGRSLSIELIPRDVQALAGRTELRRVAMLWPDGIEWKPDEESAELFRARLDGPHGTLSFEARLDPDGRPRSFALLDAAGKASERLEVTGWSEHDQRTWPAGFVFHAGEAPVWHETLERVSGNAYFLDLLFVPADRRPDTPSEESTEVRAVDLIPCVYRRELLDEPLAWGEGLRRARQATRTTDAASLDPRPTLEIDAGGRVTCVQTRLADEGTATPAGWKRAEERPGLLTRFRNPGQLARRLESLRRRLPEGATGGVPYVRVYEATFGPPWLELVLPLRPAE